MYSKGKNTVKDIDMSASQCQEIIHYRAMEHIKYCRNINTKKAQNKRDIDIRGSRSLGYVHPEQLILPFLLSSKMKRHNLQQNRCNILCFLSQSHLYISRSKNTHLFHSLKYNSLIQKEGFPSREKKPKLSISFIVRSSA